MYLKKMAHIQQHAQITESYTAKSPCSWSQHLPTPLHLPPLSQHAGIPQQSQDVGRLWRKDAGRQGNVPCSGGLSARRLGFSTNWHCSSWGSCSVRKDPWSCRGQAQCFDPWGIASRMWLILMPKGYSWPVQREIVIGWGWIGWRLAKLTSSSEEKQILHAGQ